MTMKQCTLYMHWVQTQTNYMYFKAFNAGAQPQTTVTSPVKDECPFKQCQMDSEGIHSVHVHTLYIYLALVNGGIDGCFNGIGILVEPGWW